MSRHGVRPRSATVVAVASAAALLLSGCSAGGGTGGGAPTSVTIAIPDEILTLDPSLSQVLSVNKTVFDTLTDTSGEGELIPGLATEWSANEDSSVWVYTLRDGVTFSDGTDLTADDVVYTYVSTQQRDDAINKSYLSSVTSVEKTADDQVTFTLSAPNASWPRTTTLISIVSQAAYEADPDGYASEPLGSGPYTVSGFSSAGLDLTVNENYWGDAPAFDNATITTLVDSAARLNALQTGEVDAALITPTQVAPAEGAGLTVESTESNGVAYLGFNTSTPGLDEEELRQAISLAIDREAISTTLLGELATPIGQLVAPVVAGYDGDVPVDGFDPEEARALVESSGYDGAPIDFEYPTDGWIPQASEVAQAIQGYLDDVGIAVTMTGKSSQTVTEDWLGNAMTGIYMFGFKPSTMDAEIVLGLLYGEGSKGYAVDPAIDDLIAQERAEADPAARTSLIGEIWELSNTAGYYAPLFNDTYSYATTGTVAIEPRSDGYVIPADLTPAE